MRSLRLRLIAFAALAIAVALWAAWHVMGMLFEHYTERRMADALVRDGKAVAAAVHLDAQGRPVAISGRSRCGAERKVAARRATRTGRHHARMGWLTRPEQRLGHHCST